METAQAKSKRKAIKAVPRGQKKVAERKNLNVKSAGAQNQNKVNIPKPHKGKPHEEN